jgi:hypothetical protein
MMLFRWPPVCRQGRLSATIYCRADARASPGGEGRAGGSSDSEPGPSDPQPKEKKLTRNGKQGQGQLSRQVESGAKVLQIWHETGCS